MGIASSTESNSRYDLFILERLDELKEVKLEDRPEKLRVAVQAAAEATLEVFYKELHALFPRKLGESSGHTEGDENDQVLVRFCDFMKGGGCKESFKALEDCVEDTQSVTKCKEHLPILKKCMDAHIDYYEPILALAKTTEEKATKEILAFIEEERQELAARKPS